MEVGGGLKIAIRIVGLVDFLILRSSTFSYLSFIPTLNSSVHNLKAVVKPVAHSITLRLPYIYIYV